MTLRAALALLLVLGPLPAMAQAVTPPLRPEARQAVAAEATAEDARAVYEALLLPGIIDVMAQEGAAHGDDLAEALFPRVVPAGWPEVVRAIYDPARMEAEVLAALEESLAGEEVAAILSFVTAEPGRSLVARELAAREAFLDPEIEQQAKEAAAVAMAEGSPRLELLRRYAEVNDLVETNVVGALNTNAAYVLGLMDGHALSPDMTEGDVLADVWAQEPQIRADTTEWVHAYLLDAYEGASDADIEAMIAFSETEAGQAMNRALFDAFDGAFVRISRELGRAAARYMTTEEL